MDENHSSIISYNLMYAYMTEHLDCQGENG